ncbi:MAG: hypothetical protein IE909_16510, partial [Campylobacterales bacterium]|nr:hypothetical protein [Campylobacterales bacterium]
IQNYLAKFSGLVIYEDSELSSLKLELKSLESKLQELIQQKQEYLNDIEEFNKEYNLHLGDIIKSIFRLKKEILAKKTILQQKQKEKYKEDMLAYEETKEAIEEFKVALNELKSVLDVMSKDDENYEKIAKVYKELQEKLKNLEDELASQEEELKKIKESIEDEAIEEEYEDVKSNYEKFEREYEHSKKIDEARYNLSDEEKKELKMLYKKAARLCHPDIVADELKAKATEIIQKLNEAYSKYDIKEVRRILNSLETGAGFKLSSETITDKELLKSKIKEVKEALLEVEQEIEIIMADDTYQTIAGLDDWDEYFEKIKSKLELEKEKLEEEAKSL